jgi:hypothetical protein
MFVLLTAQGGLVVLEIATDVLVIIGDVLELIISTTTRDVQTMNVLCQKSLSTLFLGEVIILII